MTTRNAAWPTRRKSSRTREASCTSPLSSGELHERVPRVRGVLFDRDGTIVVDVPYNGDPEQVRPVTDAKAALDRLRAAGLKIGVLTNQSGVGRGLITLDQVHAVNARVATLLGPFDGWYICPHAPADNCECRKPKPKLVFDAARDWGVAPEHIAVVGDRESDAGVARNAGAFAVLVGPERTLAQAVDQILERSID